MEAARFTFRPKRTWAWIAPWVAVGLPFACALVGGATPDPIGVILLAFASVVVVLAGIVFVDRAAVRGLVTRPRRSFEIFSPDERATYREQGAAPVARVDGRVVAGARRVAIRLDQTQAGPVRHVPLVQLADEVVQLAPLGADEARAQAEAIARALELDPPGEPRWPEPPSPGVTVSLVVIVVVELGAMIAPLAYAVTPRGKAPQLDRLLLAAAAMVAAAAIASALMVAPLRHGARKMVRDLFGRES